MVTPVIHPKTEPLRTLAKQFAEAPVFVKERYAVEFFDQLLTALAAECHRADKLEARVAALERFPELDELQRLGTFTRDS